MKKVLLFICTLDDGGAQRVVSILSSELANLDYEVEILKYYKSENIYPLNPKIKVSCVEENTKSNNILINISWMRNYFRNNCDIIISFLASYNMLALLANPGKPIIVADRNDPKRIPSNPIIRILRNSLYKKADYIVAQTENNKNYFNSDKCVVINNPMDIEKYVGMALSAAKKHKIVSVGRLTKQKNQLMLIDAFNEIHKKHNDYELYIYGEYRSYKNILDEKVNSLGLNNCVFMPGSKKDILCQIKDSEVFVLSSDYEGMPNALIEAMCIGLPCISTNVSGANELIQNGQNGYLIDVGNTSQLIEKLELLINDQELAKQIGKNACEISDNFNKHNIVNKWVKLINSL